eukprot:435002_1
MELTDWPNERYAAIWVVSLDVTFHSFKMIFPDPMDNTDELRCSAYLYDSIDGHCYGYYGDDYNVIQQSLSLDPQSKYNSAVLYDSETCPPLPTAGPSAYPSSQPSASPSQLPSVSPSQIASEIPSASPSQIPSVSPSQIASASPSEIPSALPSQIPSVSPSQIASASPSEIPSALPSQIPSVSPSQEPSLLVAHHRLNTTQASASTLPMTTTHMTVMTSLGSDRSTQTRAFESSYVFVVILAVLCSVVCVVAIKMKGQKRVSEKLKVNMNANAKIDGVIIIKIDGVKIDGTTGNIAPDEFEVIGEEVGEGTAQGIADVQQHIAQDEFEVIGEEVGEGTEQ